MTRADRQNQEPALTPQNSSISHWHGLCNNNNKLSNASSMPGMPQQKTTFSCRALRASSSSKRKLTSHLTRTRKVGEQLLSMYAAGVGYMGRLGCHKMVSSCQYRHNQARHYKWQGRRGRSLMEIAASLSQNFDMPEHVRSHTL